LARRRKADEVVDGYTALQAAQRAAAKGVRLQPAEAKSAVQPPGPEKPEDPDHDIGKVRVGHTAQPTRHDIVCYECGFSFFLAGQLKTTYCPKCRSMLEATEKTIDSEWVGSLKTIGLVRITATGVVKDGSVIAANCLQLEGRIAGGKVEVFGRLDVCPGGTFAQDAVRVADLSVKSGAVLRIEKELSLKSIEIAGEFHGKIKATGVVAVRAGGYLAGDVVGHHLVIEDGAALNAIIDITPQTVVSEKPGTRKQGEWTAAEGNRRSAA
jgi:cytoskeletal protein CcmA (bactofilin family)